MMVVSESLYFLKFKWQNSDSSNPNFVLMSDGSININLSICISKIGYIILHICPKSCTIDPGHISGTGSSCGE